jgi:hypothetical protein
MSLKEFTIMDFAASIVEAVIHSVLCALRRPVKNDPEARSDGMALDPSTANQNNNFNDDANELNTSETPESRKAMEKTSRMTKHVKGRKSTGFCDVPDELVELSRQRRKSSNTSATISHSNKLVILFLRSELRRRSNFE